MKNEPMIWYSKDSSVAVEPSEARLPGIKQTNNRIGVRGLNGLMRNNLDFPIAEKPRRLIRREVLISLSRQLLRTQ